MKRTWLFLLITAISGAIQAQHVSSDLIGTYILDSDSSEQGLYDAFVFNGAGKVEIQTSLIHTKYDFFQVDDTIVIYPDKSIFLFRQLEDGKLMGISAWIEGLIYRQIENDTVPIPELRQEQNYLNNYYEYYKLLGGAAPDLMSYIELATKPDFKASMEKLCDNQFSKACITLANAAMIGTLDMTSLLNGTTGKGEKKLPDRKVIQYYEKAVKLKDPDAITQLGAYFLLLNDLERAEYLFKKGCEEGIQECCFSLIGLTALEEEED